MKNIIKKIIFKILKWEAQAVLFHYRPRIIAITGSVGKTTTKDAVYKSLSNTIHIRKNSKSMNSEIGVPLTILGLETGWNDLFHWIKNILMGFVQIFFHPHYPKWLVLEIGVDTPGDMRKTASWLKPDVAVITSFPNVPVHVEYFDSPEEVAAEKSQLIDYLKEDGVIILNADDENVLKLKNHAKNRVFTYGKENADSDLFASNYSVVYDNDSGAPSGISFKISYDGNTLPISISGVIGEHHVYPALVSLTIGRAMNFSLVALSEGLHQFKSPVGRMNLLEGKNNSTIIDDTYNASPIAMQKAVETLASIETPSGAPNAQKIAILGDMTEIGRFTAKEHRNVGDLIKDNKIDHLIAVGVRARLIAEQAIERGMAKGRVHTFDTSEEVAMRISDAEFIEKINLLAPGNIILVKGSQVMRMEKIVKELIKEKDPAIISKILVRQEKEWLSR